MAGVCVDTTRECVDTLSHLRKIGLLETGSSVDTSRDCVDTLDLVFMKLLKGLIPSVDTINGKFTKAPQSIDLTLTRSDTSCWGSDR
ncbi:hypothetical protein Taro_022133 [Colocasia esculenta]|uniref:Uncharacterized protein n=1 Tax=Colocasia esculenta TaxID=4460 RepID=A0A843V0N4_COLES|nr:hypothetical protein [Colocasia esculenta]